MQLTGTTVLHLAQYSAPYEGNFIRSLTALEAALASQGVAMAYVFPALTGRQPWYADFARHRRTYLTSDDLDHADGQLLDIVLEVRPRLVHCHFDGYDVPMARTLRRYRRQTAEPVAEVWHLHNVKGVTHHGLRKVYWGLRFALHYGYHGRDAAIISVGDYMNAFANRYHRLVCWRDFAHRATIPNGIDLRRLSAKTDYEPHSPYTFLAHGGRNVQKRIDVLLAAAEAGVAEGLDLCVKITEGLDTRAVVDAHFGGKVPAWCQVIAQDDDINRIFAQADCFVSSSIHEGHSYAICEATIYGLPVVQSDVDGNRWNSDSPSAFPFPPLDSAVLLQRMKQVMQTSADTMAERCAQTRHRNMSLYSIEQWCGNILDYYRGL